MAKRTYSIDCRVLQQVRTAKNWSVARLASELGIEKRTALIYLKAAEEGEPRNVLEDTYFGMVKALRNAGVDISTLLWTGGDAPLGLSIADVIPNFESAAPSIRSHFSQTSSVLAYIQQRTEHFVGRSFVFDRLDDFMSGHSSGYFVINGEPGIGKTTIIARLVETRRCIFHFHSEVVGTTSTEAFLQHVCAQLIARHQLEFDKLPNDAARDGAFLGALLHQAATKLDNEERLLIAVDALDEWDESGVPSGANPLFLPPVLPDNVFFVVTTKEPVDSLHLNVAVSFGHLELKHDSEGNIADAREYVEQRLDSPAITEWMQEQSLTRKTLAAELLERSEHNFMYLHHVLAAIEAGDFRGLSARELPVGLQGYYRMHWRRMQQDVERFEEDYKPVVCALACAEDPMTADEIATFWKLPYDRVVEVLEAWRRRSYVLRHDPEDDGDFRFSLYHRPFQDFLAEEVDYKLRGYREQYLATFRDMLDDVDL